MSKRPCAWCRAKGMTTKPCVNTKTRVQVVKCSHCDRFRTDLEAANWHYNRPKVVEFDGVICIVVEVGDEIIR